MSESILEVQDLKTFFDTDMGIVKAVNGVSFSVGRGQTVGIVGESGCGKSMTAMSIMKLIPKNGRIAGGKISFQGQDITHYTREQMNRINGKEISIIFQEPMTSLNPVFTVGYQIAETLIYHEHQSKAQARKQAVEMIDTVGIPRADEIFDEYPHELSGGMRQRIMIAMALACHPSLLIADEPTTALDVTIQAQILDLLRKMKKDFGMSIMMITHDLGVIAEMAEYVVVMYAGRIVERGPVLDIFRHPSHPYTIGLLKSKPRLNERRDRLYSIPGQVPNLIGLPDQCYFYDRCDRHQAVCKNGFPREIEVGPGHFVACTAFEGGNR